MAVLGPTIHDVAATGSDGNAPADDNNAGAFDPTTNSANFFTDLTTDTNTGNSASPVVSSASYNFVAGDAGSWVFISGGTNWTPGWYKIASVASNKATLDAAIGNAILYSTGGPYSPNTAAGVATVGTPTSGVWTMCYSRVGTAPQSFTDLASTNGTNATPTVTSASYSFVKKDVGNFIKVNSGSNWTTGIYRITNTSAGGAVLDRACGSSATLSSGTWRLGGCLLSPGQAGANHVAGNHIFIKNATYTIGSATQNISTGCLQLVATSAAANRTSVFGYASVWGDAPKGSTRPLLQASGISTSVLVEVQAGGQCAYLRVDGAAQTSSRGIRLSNVGAQALFCSALNCTNSGFVSTSNGATFFGCDATGCSSVAAFSGSAGVFFTYCVAWSNTISGFTSGGIYHNCYSLNNSGASSDGFTAASVGLFALNCVAYGNGRDGFRMTGSASVNQTMINCIAHSNNGTNYNSTAVADGILLINCAAGNGAANVSTNINLDGQIGNITLTADPFTNPASNDYSLNIAAGGGALLRSSAGVFGTFPGISTVTYEDIGPAQHQDVPPVLNKRVTRYVEMSM